MNTTLVCSGDIAERFEELVALEIETGGVILARPVATTHGLRLLVRELIDVPEDAYDRREAQELLIRSSGYVPALSLAESQGCVPIWFHTHPSDLSSPRPSRHDLRVNDQLSDLFRLRSGGDYYGWLIVSGSGASITFAGGLDDGITTTSIDRLWVVGPRLTLMRNHVEVVDPLPDLYDRNIRAFGGDVQRVLRDLTVAVVGCGGTGSAVAEQLLRLGVRKIMLIDPEELSESNVTRVYGSRLEDVGRPKVDVLARHLESIFADATITCIKSMVTVETTAKAMVDSDVIFGCTDDNAGRMVLSRFATFFMTPVIDCGVLLTSDDQGKLDGIHGRVTVLHSGEACLICRGRVDLFRARSELLSPTERVRLVSEGYAESVSGIEPAVITYTTMVAAAAVSELLERLTHYGVDPTPSELLLRLHDRELSTNNQPPNERHYCDPKSGKLGLGLTSPFLEQTWP